MRVAGMDTVADRWSLIESECSTKSLMQQTYEKEEFLGRKCPEGSNVREFLNKLREDRELLLQSGGGNQRPRLRQCHTHLPSQMDIEVRRPAPCFDEEPGGHDGRIREHARCEKLTHEQLTLLTRIDANALITEISNKHDRDQREKSRRRLGFLSTRIKQVHVARHLRISHTKDQ